jgi:hypothetical protein
MKGIKFLKAIDIIVCIDQRALFFRMRNIKKL